MIKKSISKYNFTPQQLLIGDGTDTNTITGGYAVTGGYTVTGYNTTIGYQTGLAPQTMGNNNFVINNGGVQTFTVTNDGSATFTGVVHSVGAVMYNSILNRLETWSGEQWVPILT